MFCGSLTSTVVEDAERRKMFLKTVELCSGGLNPCLCHKDFYVQ